MKKVIILFFAWIVIINVFALLVLNRFNLKGDTAYAWIDPNNFSQDYQWNPVSLHSRWDSIWHLGIAKNGYFFKESERLSNIVFFPLYPMLIRVASNFVGGNLIFSGWIVSSIFLLLASIYLFKLTKEFHPKVDPFLPIIFLLIFPTAFFLNAVYTESLFLFLSITVFYYAFKKNFILASFIGMLASLTRITGILLFIPLIWEYLRYKKFTQIFSLKLLSIFLIPLGTFSFFIFHYFKFGNFFLFLKVQSWWGRSFVLNREHFKLLTSPAIVNLFLDVSFVIFAIIAVYFVFKKLRVSYGLYMAATLLMALSTGTLMSIGRYILVLFPIYILIASVKNKLVKQSYVFTSILLLAMNIILFVNGYWAG